MSNLQWVKENWPVRMCLLWCCMNALLFFVPTIVNRLQQEMIFVVSHLLFTLSRPELFLIQWFLSPFSFSLLLLYLSVLQRLCESVSYENMCKCCWFKDKSKRWYPVKNTCPLGSTSPALLSLSISVLLWKSQFDFRLCYVNSKNYILKVHC